MCMHICKFVCVCVCMYVSVYVYVSVNVCMYVIICIYIFMYVYMNMYVCMNVCSIKMRSTNAPFLHTLLMKCKRCIIFMSSLSRFCHYIIHLFWCSPTGFGISRKGWTHTSG